MGWRAGLAAGALAVLAVAGPAAAPVRTHAATLPGEHYTLTSGAKTVTDGPPGSTQTKSIAYDLYVPDSAAHTPQPAVLLTHGFGLSKSSSEMTIQADYLARHGYVVLVYTSSGFGTSGGCIELDSVDWDIEDATQMVDILDARSDVLHAPDPRAGGAVHAVVGMAGGSYGGGATLLTAERDMRIRAIAASRTWNSLQQSLLPDNLVAPPETLPDGVFKQEWSSLLFASGASQPVSGNGGCPAVQGNAVCPGFDPALCQTYVAVSQAGGATSGALATVARSSPATFISSLTVPTLLTQGQSDTLFNEDEVVQTYTALRARGVPVRMLWNLGGHGGYGSAPGEGEVYDGLPHTPDTEFLPQQTLAWFDHWLRGLPTDTGPGFRWFRDWVSYPTTGTADPAYGSAPQYPAEASAVFTLDAGGSALLGNPVAGATPPAAAAASATVVSPPNGTPASYSETSNFQAPGSTLPVTGAPSPFVSVPPTDPPGEAATFTSQPFPRDVASVGIPTAHLLLSHVNGQDLFLFGKVFDVDSSGSATLIHRLAAPWRVPAADLAGSGPVAVDVQLLGFAHLFPAGHSVRLVLAATDQAYINQRVADVITVTTGGAQAATFSLPVDAAPAPVAATTPVPVTPPAVAPVTAATPNTSAAVPGSPAVAAVAAATLLLGAAGRRRRRVVGTPMGILSPPVDSPPASSPGGPP